MLQNDTKATQTILPQGLALIREVEMEVIFGTPSKNCSGAGICLIANRSARWDSISCPHTPAILHFSPGQELVFRFRKRHLDTPALQAYFGCGSFLVEESFSLPSQIVRRWALPFSSIPPGRYLLEEYSQEWRLYFPIPPQT